jgi:hypothetical protein
VYKNCLWTLNERSWATSVGIATEHGLDGMYSNPGKEQDFSFFRNVQTGSGVHQAFYPMGTGGDFPGGKAARA